MLLAHSRLFSMEESKQSSGKGMLESLDSNNKGKAKPPLKGNKKGKSKFDSNAGGEDVLLKLPGGFTYKMPGKRQRVVIGSIVLGLNFLLVVAVVLYFYSPAFQDFIYTVGRS